MHIEMTIKDYRLKLAAAIRRARLEEDMSQMQLAVKSNVALKTINEIETCKYENVTFKTVNKLCAVLGIKCKIILSKE